MGRVERENVGKICFPSKVGEADIAYKIKIRLEAYRDFICRQQVRAFCEFGGRIRKNLLDLIVFDSNCNAIAIVEVKSGGRRPRAMRRTKQIQKYEAFGIPLFWCRGVEMVDEVVQNIADLPNWTIEGPKGG